MARLQGHRVILVGQEVLGTGRAALEYGCIDGHGEVCKERWEQKGIESSVFTTVHKIVLQRRFVLLRQNGIDNHVQKLGDTLNLPLPQPQMLSSENPARTVFSGRRGGGGGRS